MSFFKIEIITLLINITFSVFSQEFNNPNVIIIMADDLGYGDLGCYNSESKIPTPNIDRLSKQGILFTDAHSAASVCTPSRYALLMGKYCWRSHLKKSVSWSGYDHPLIDKDEMTLADLFKRSGYTTAVIGKWHLGLNFLRQEHNDFVQPKTNHEKGLSGVKDVNFSKPIYNGPNYLGFDYAFLSAAGHNMEPFCYIENDFTVGIPKLWREAHDTLFPGVSSVEVHEGWMVEGWDPRKVGPDLTRKAIEFIENSCNNNPNEPFFLYFPTVSPHRPCTPPDFIKGKSQAGDRGDMVAEFDWTVGEIMKSLSKLGIDKKTLLIVTSDNGATATSDNGKNYGHKSCGNLRGFKGTLYEGGHRIPLIMSWPEYIEENQVNNHLICLTDIYSTVKAITNVEQPNYVGEDSFNVLPTITNNEVVRDNLVMHDYSGNFAIRHNEWKLILHGNILVNSKELYNLNMDPKEENNLTQKYPEMVLKLEKLLNQIKFQGYSNQKFKN